MLLVESIDMECVCEFGEGVTQKFLGTRSPRFCRGHGDERLACTSQRVDLFHFLGLRRPAAALGCGSLAGKRGRSSRERQGCRRGPLGYARLRRNNLGVAGLRFRPREGRPLLRQAPGHEPALCEGAARFGLSHKEAEGMRRNHRAASAVFGQLQALACASYCEVAECREEWLRYLPGEKMLAQRNLRVLTQKHIS